MRKERARRSFRDRPLPGQAAGMARAEGRDHWTQESEAMRRGSAYHGMITGERAWHAAGSLIVREKAH